MQCSTGGNILLVKVHFLLSAADTLVTTTTKFNQTSEDLFSMIWEMLGQQKMCVNTILYERKIVNLKAPCSISYGKGV